MTTKHYIGLVARNIFRHRRVGVKSCILRHSMSTLTIGGSTPYYRREKYRGSAMQCRHYTDRRDLTDISVLQVIKDTAYIFFQGKNISKITKALFASCENQAYDPMWFTGGKLEEKFRTKLLLMVTHVWIYHRKLYVDQDLDVRALRIQDIFFEILWEDSMHRLAAEKVGSLMLSKYLKEVQILSFQVCMAYDEALALADENDPEDTQVVYALGGVVWNNLYERRDDIPEEHVLEFARYMIREHKRVFYLPYEEFVTGSAPWGPVPEFKNISRSGIKAGQGPGREWKSPIMLKEEEDKRKEQEEKDKKMIDKENSMQ